MRQSRPRFWHLPGLTWLVAALLLLLPTSAAGGSVSVPVDLQAKLMVKVAGYDGNLPSRSGGTVRVGILTLPGNTDSERAEAQLRRALGSVGKISGLPHEEVSLKWSDGAALARECRDRNISILYVTPGLSAQVPKMRSSLDGVSVLSVGAVAGYVADGIVLGFDLVSGKPKLVVNLPQAKRQNVKFSSRVLKLMRVIE
jgi:hypothetical protein